MAPPEPSSKTRTATASSTSPATSSSSWLAQMSQYVQHNGKLSTVFVRNNSRFDLVGCSNAEELIRLFHSNNFVDPETTCFLIESEAKTPLPPSSIQINENDVIHPRFKFQLHRLALRKEERNACDEIEANYRQMKNQVRKIIKDNQDQSASVAAADEEQRHQSTKDSSDVVAVSEKSTKGKNSNSKGKSPSKSEKAGENTSAKAVKPANNKRSRKVVDEEEGSNSATTQQQQQQSPHNDDTAAPTSLNDDDTTTEELSNDGKRNIMSTFDWAMRTTNQHRNASRVVAKTEWGCFTSTEVYVYTSDKVDAKQMVLLPNLNNNVSSTDPYKTFMDTVRIWYKGSQRVVVTTGNCAQSGWCCLSLGFNKGPQMVKRIKAGETSDVTDELNRVVFTLASKHTANVKDKTGKAVVQALMEKMPVSSVRSMRNAIRAYLNPMFDVNVRIDKWNSNSLLKMHLPEPNTESYHQLDTKSILNMLNTYCSTVKASRPDSSEYKNRPPVGIKAPRKITPACREFLVKHCGAEIPEENPMFARTEGVRLFSKYIRNNKLNKGNVIYLDDTLKQLCETARSDPFVAEMLDDPQPHITFFKMSKVHNHFFLKKDDAAAAPAVAVVTEQTS